MKPILIIAPHKKIERLSKDIAKRYDDVEVQLGLLDEAVRIAKKSEKQGVEVIISRGGTARKIEKLLPTMPVIEIPVSPYDMLDAISEAKKIGKNIVVLGFENIIHDVEKAGPILDIDLRTYNIENQQDAERYLRELIDSGKKIDVLLGGTVAEKLASKYNIPTILLNTGIKIIEDSIKAARRLVEVRQKEKEKTEQFKAILHYINEGVISVDNQGIITTFNSAAEKILGISDRDIVGKPIKKFIPDTKLIKVMKKNKAELGQIIQMEKIQILANRVPIVVKDKVVGAVATFQDITKIQEYEQRIRSKLLDKGYVSKYNFFHIKGKSKKILEAKAKAIKYASTDSTVLITGESGTGKEMFAQSIHSESERKRGPFVAVNCAAIPKNLLESELFGYEEGAFTGASKKGKTGLFVQAHGGTIFLDEIGEISTELQARLLRVVQEREVRPIGSNRVIPIDVRIISATNKNLLVEVQKGNFRRDLYYRLNILKLHIPTLAERKEDIKLLSEHFIDRFSHKYVKNIKISNNALKELEKYHWPGNIRELENVIESLVVLAHDMITAAEVREMIKEHEVDEGGNPDTLEEVKRRHIFKILSECKGNQTMAADRLGISRTHLWRILKKYQN